MSMNEQPIQTRGSLLVIIDQIQDGIAKAETIAMMGVCSKQSDPREIEIMETSNNTESDMIRALKKLKKDYLNDYSQLKGIE